MKFKTLDVASVLYGGLLNLGPDDYERLIVYLSGKFRWSDEDKNYAREQLKKQFPELNHVIEKFKPLQDYPVEDYQIMWFITQLEEQFGKYLEVKKLEFSN